jgi:hypothetical protein
VKGNATAAQIGTGRLDSITFPARQNTTFVYTFRASYAAPLSSSLASTDPIFSDLLLRCSSATAAPARNIKINLDIRVSIPFLSNVFGIRPNFTESESIPCPFTPDIFDGLSGTVQALSSLNSAIQGIAAAAGGASKGS